MSNITTCTVHLFSIIYLLTNSITEEYLSYALLINILVFISDVTMAVDIFYNRTEKIEDYGEPCHSREHGEGLLNK